MIKAAFRSEDWGKNDPGVAMGGLGMRSDQKFDKI